jgi:hypothetical protein
MLPFVVMTIFAHFDKGRMLPLVPQADGRMLTMGLNARDFMEACSARTTITVSGRTARVASVQPVPDDAGGDVLISLEYVAK